MLYFSKRAALANRFYNWARREGAANTVDNAIAFLLVKGLLDEEKAEVYLKSGDDKEVDNGN